MIDISGGDKVPRKRGPGMITSDLLVINKINQAPYVGASLEVIEHDSHRAAIGRLYSPIARRARAWRVRTPSAAARCWHGARERLASFRAILERLCCRSAAGLVRALGTAPSQVLVALLRVSKVLEIQ